MLWTTLFSVTVVLAGEPASGGWLGVRVDTPGPALTSQLRLQNGGLLVVNVAENSPAAQAGIQLYDIVLELDGQTVSSGFEQFAELIGATAPTQRLALRILREGRPLELAAVIGTMPDDLSWRHDDDPEEIYSQELAIKGRVVRRQEDGSIVIEELDNTEAAELGVFLLLPDRQRSTSQVWVEDGQAHLLVTVQSDGQRYEFLQRGARDITVRQFEANGAISEFAFPDSQALERINPRLHRLFAEARTSAQPTLPAPFLLDTKRFGRKPAPQPAEPSYHFIELPQGAIRVTVTLEDTVWEKTFTDGAALADQKPALYERYLQSQPSRE